MEKTEGIREFIGRNLPGINRLNVMAFFGLSITTLYTANTTALTRLRIEMGDWAYLAPIIALLIGLLVVSFFDMDLRKNFITALQAVTASDWNTAGRGLKVVAIFILFIGIVRFSLSTGATVISGAFMADDMVEEVNTDGLERMMVERDATKQTIASSLSAQIREIKTSAHSEAERLENSAIDKGSASWAKLWRSGNGWIKTVSGAQYREVEKWRNGIYAAQKEGDRIIAAANQEARELRKTSTAMIQAETADPTFAAIAAAKAAKVDKAARREMFLRIGLWTLDGLFSIIALLSSIGLVIGAKENPSFRIFRDKETTFSDVAKEAITATKRIFLSYGVALVSGLDAKAVSVASTLSQGRGEVDLTATALKMNRAQQEPKQAATPPTVAPKQPQHVAPKQPQQPLVAPKGVRVAPKQPQQPKHVAPQQAATERNVAPQQTATSRNTVSNSVSADDAALLAETLSKAKSNLRAYVSRLNKAKKAQQSATTKDERNSYGATIATNRNGVKKWSKAVKELEAQLQEMK